MIPSDKHEAIRYGFTRPEELSPGDFMAILRLIREGAAVGMSWAEGNLRDAYLIGYAKDEKNLVVGCMVLKQPKKIYLEKIKALTGLDLSGFLERGYTSIAEPFRGRGVADRLIDGLNRRSRGKKIYVTIRMDNAPALHLTEKHGMRLAGRFMNPGTGSEVGVFTNSPVQRVCGRHGDTPTPNP